VKPIIIKKPRKSEVIPLIPSATSDAKMDRNTLPSPVISVIPVVTAGMPVDHSCIAIPVKPVVTIVMVV
jgi:hypothetical protein